MVSFQFVHAADLHLDTPFVGIGQAASEALRETLRDASLDAWDALVDLVIERDAAFLVLAGDIYDGAVRGVRAQLRFLRGLERLAARQIPVFIIHGNHDPLDGWSAIGDRWPPGVTVFGGTDVDAVPVVRDGVQLATVYGISYGTRDVAENLSLRYRRGTGPGVHVGLLHCNVGADAEHGSYSPCSLQDLLDRRLDYWALGHIHKRQTLSEGRTWVVYPGNTQGRSPKPSETGAKGAVVVDVAGGDVTGAAFVPLDRVRFGAVTIDVGGVTDLGTLRNELTARAEALRSEHEGRGLLLRATLTGRGPLYAALVRPGVIDELLHALRDEAGLGEPVLWWDKLSIDVRPDIDRAAVRRRDDFAAALLGLADELRSDADRLDHFTREVAEAPVKLKAGRAAPPLDPNDLAKLLQDAEDVVLDLIEDGGGA